MAGPLLAMMSQMGGMAFGSQLGQALGKLSREVLTSTDIGLPLGPKGVAALMPEAVESLAEGLEQPRSEILTFLAAREAAHHRLFSHVPWLSTPTAQRRRGLRQGHEDRHERHRGVRPGLQPRVADRSRRDGTAAESGHLRTEGDAGADRGAGAAGDAARPDRGMGADRGDRRAGRPDPGHVGAQRDAAPAPRHRRPRRADLRHPGRAGTAAAQDARGRGAVGTADRGRRRRRARRACGSTPTCCPAPRTSTSPRASSTA